MSIKIAQMIRMEVLTQISVDLKKELSEYFPGVTFYISLQTHGLDVDYINGPNIDNVTTVTASYAHVNTDPNVDLVCGDVTVNVNRIVSEFLP